MLPNKLWGLQRKTLILWSFWVSRGSYRVNLGGTLPVLGWCSGWSWFWEQRDNSKPWNSSCGSWSLWLLLLRTCGFPKHLYLNGKTKPIPFSPHSMVNKILKFLSPSTRPLSCTIFLCTNYAFLIIVTHLLSKITIWFNNNTNNISTLDFYFPYSFGICTLLYAGVAVMGYKMFGEATQSQFTLNMPQDLVATKIAVWTTVCSSFNI